MKFEITEDYKLCKGVFWVKDVEKPDKYFCFKIDCDTDGNPLGSEFALNAKSGTTYNHRSLWSLLSTQLTNNKPYNYYPRGRVEIKGGVARIFLNGNLFTENIVNFIIDEYKLNKCNGIRDIKVIVDNSKHYLCHLDSGWSEKVK